MIATYVARITLENEGNVSEVEKILNTQSFTQPHLYAVSTTPVVMLVSPYKDNQGREVRSFELTKYLVDSGLLPADPKEQGSVTKAMARAILEKVEGKSPRVELYRVSATDLISDEYIFFQPYPHLAGRGPGPFVPYTWGPDIRGVIYTDSQQHLFKQG